MKTKFKLFNFLFVILAVGFTACEGDQGEIGPKGDKGDTGTTGTTGANGTGFDELTQYGNIEVTFSGKRQDDVDFTQTLDFTYMPTSGVSENSSWYQSNESESRFYLSRENKGLVSEAGRTNEGGEKNAVWLEFDKTSDGVSITYIGFYTDIVTSDFKVFELNCEDGTWNEAFQNPSVTNFNFNAATGKLTFNFSHTIPANLSSTAHDVTITGKVDVTVFESIYLPG
jgi:hypothetical protein